MNMDAIRDRGQSATDRQRLDFRLAELVAALSLATDLGTGQPMEHALRTCLLSVRIGRELGLDDEQRRELYYVALLRLVGCTADSHDDAMLFGGDELTFRAQIAPVFMGEMSEMLGKVVRHAGVGQSPLHRMRLLFGVLTDLHGVERALTAHCEAARLLATQLGLSESIRHALAHGYERWDGKGFPDGLAGEDVPLSVRIAVAARDVDVLHRTGGIELVREVLGRRSGRAYDPTVVDAFLSHGDRLIAELDQREPWDAVLEEEPSPQERVGEARLDRIFRAFAAFADLQSLYMRGHSYGVAELVEGAAHAGGLPAAASVELRRAALIHDLGRIGVPTGIWDKPGALTQSEWERVRLHPYLTERIVGRCASLMPLALLAGAHHERMDGSGYHRGSPAQLLSYNARILAATDAYQAMTEDRAHRPALSATTAAEQLRLEVDAGRLDRQAVQAVLDTVGQPAKRLPSAWPAGLSDREVEVLRLIARGFSNREVADRLSISAKTVGHHVEHIYTKIGISTRAGAALFAMEHDLMQA